MNVDTAHKLYLKLSITSSELPRLLSLLTMHMYNIFEYTVYCPPKYKCTCVLKFEIILCCRYAVPQTPFSIPVTVNCDDLSSLINSILQQGNCVVQ